MPTIANEFTVRKTPEQLPILVTEPLHLYINQAGVLPGLQKLEQLKYALRLRDVPGIQAQDGQGFKATAFVKFFDPCGSYTAYVTEWDREYDGGDIVFGFVVWHEAEWGDISLADLASRQGPLRIGIEIDTHFLPCPLGEEIKRRHPEVNVS